MAKRLLSGIVIIMLALSLNSMGCGIMNGSNNNSSINGIPPDTPNIAKVEGMSSSPFGLGVKLKPINAKADTKYIVDLEEKGNLRERTNITWNQPQINVRATQTLFFGLTNVEYDAYTTASMNDSNWWKPIFSVKIHETTSPNITSVSGKVVTFVDANLQDAIRKRINKPTGQINQADLQAITQLDVEKRNIINLSGIEYCTNLTKLVLDFNQITDISPLASLNKLNSLFLNGNRISDISPLVANSGLSNGDFIYLLNNPLSVPSISTYIPQLISRGVTVYYSK